MSWAKYEFEMREGSNEMRRISIASFIEEVSNSIGIRILGFEDKLEETFIYSSRIQKLGLSLSGFSQYIHFGRFQVLGESEISYLGQLSERERYAAFKNLDFSKLSCILVTKKPRPTLRFYFFGDKK